MITQRYIFQRIFVASCVLCSVVPKLNPVPALVKLAVSGSEVSERVEWSIIRVANYRLGGVSHSVQKLFKD